jgi:hypothetical protein
MLVRPDDALSETHPLPAGTFGHRSATVMLRGQTVCASTEVWLGLDWTAMALTVPLSDGSADRPGLAPLR